MTGQGYGCEGILDGRNLKSSAGGGLINNRLTVVLGHIDLCLERITPKNTLHQSLLMIRKNVQLAGRLSNKLLLFGQKQLQFKTPINLNRNIKEISFFLSKLKLDRARWLSCHMVWLPRLPLPESFLLMIPISLIDGEQ